MFITFEGVDGSGKTTLVNGLCSVLEKKGVSCIRTTEPGGGGLDSFPYAIRELFTNHSGSIPLTSELLLLLSARHYNIQNTILPALKNRCWVVCDRFNDSMYAYQGYGSGFDRQNIRILLERSGCDLEPDLTFFIDLEPEISLSRIKRLDRIERRSLVFYRLVYEGYKRIAEKFPNRIVALRGKKSFEELLEDVLDILRARNLLQNDA